MKPVIQLVALVFVAAAPAVSFAQSSNVPLDRAQVRHELVQLERAGYRPSKSQYPDGIQAAEARIGSFHGSAGTVDSSVGGASGASETGYRAPTAGLAPLYSRH
jgi:hypothetical protein